MPKIEIISTCPNLQESLEEILNWDFKELSAMFGVVIKHIFAFPFAWIHLDLIHSTYVIMQGDYSISIF